MMRLSIAMALLANILLSSLVLAAEISIPSDQPICRLYGIIKVFGTVAGVIVAAYAGFTLATSTGIEERNKSKQIISGVIMGLIIIWLAPSLVKSLVGASDICGW